jgi:hypothetical protein
MDLFWGRKREELPEKVLKMKKTNGSLSSFSYVKYKPYLQEQVGLHYICESCPFHRTNSFFFFISNKNFIKKSGNKNYTPGIYKTYIPELHLKRTKI